MAIKKGDRPDTDDGDQLDLSDDKNPVDAAPPKPPPPARATSGAKRAGRDGLRLLVNTRPNPRGHHLSVRIPGTQQSRSYSVLPFQVVCVPYEDAIKKQRAAGTADGQTNPAHPWSMLRSTDLGLDLASGGAKPPTTVEEYLSRPVDLDKLAKHFHPQDPSQDEWNPTWEPMGVPTLTKKQAMLVMTAWTFAHLRHVEGYSILLRNEKGERNEGRPFVTEVESVMQWAVNRVAYFKAELARGSGVQAPKLPFGVRMAGVSAVRRGAR